MPIVNRRRGRSRASSSNTPATMPGRELLRGQAVAAADDPRHHRPLAVGVRLAERRDHVEEQRLADRAGLLGPVEHGDPAHGRGQRLEQRLRRERPVQPDLHHADALAARVEDATVSRAVSAPEPISTSTRSASGCPL